MTDADKAALDAARKTAYDEHHVVFANTAATTGWNAGFNDGFTLGAEAALAHAETQYAERVSNALFKVWRDTTEWPKPLRQLFDELAEAKTRRVNNTKALITETHHGNMTIAMPTWFEDDEPCGWCDRPIGEPHKPSCRQ